MPQDVGRRPVRANYMFSGPISLLEHILNEYDEIRECVMEHLFPAGDVYIHAYEPGDARIATTRTTAYQAAHRDGTASDDYRIAQTATFGSRSAMKPLRTDVISNTLDRHVNVFATEMLLVSKRCYELAQPYLYRRKFNFQCSPLGVAWFLEDHYRTPISRVVLHYTFPGPHDRIVTPGSEWRELHTYLRHEFSAGLDEVQVQIEEEFWQIANWQAGPRAVLSDSALMDEGEYENFLYLLAKLPGYAWRWRLPRRVDSATVGCDLDLNIHGTNTPARAAFVAELQYEIVSRMVRRPFFLNDELKTVYHVPR